MINRRQLRKSLQHEVKKSGFMRWLEQEVTQTNFDLTDDFCHFLINPRYEVKGPNIVIQVTCTPKKGAFQNIDFRPKIFIKAGNCIERPRIFNDRRVFHPNINLLTCEVVSRQLVANWNPTTEFRALLLHLKYLLLEPELTWVPNNSYNRKAAWNYHFNRLNYRLLVIQHCPIALDALIGPQMSIDSPMEVEESGEGTLSQQEEEFWTINKVIVTNKMPCVLDLFSEVEEEQNFQLLAKRIKILHFDNETKEQAL